MGVSLILIIFHLKAFFESKATAFLLVQLPFVFMTWMDQECKAFLKQGN